MLDVAHCCGSGSKPFSVFSCRFYSRMTIPKQNIQYRQQNSSFSTTQANRACSEAQGFERQACKAVTLRDCHFMPSRTSSSENLSLKIYKQPQEDETWWVVCKNKRCDTHFSSIFAGWAGWDNLLYHLLYKICIEPYRSVCISVYMHIYQIFALHHPAMHKQPPSSGLLSS